MTENTNISVNSGVQTNVGMEFQKHCTLYLLLDNYQAIKDKKYFIILEHLEDIVFGYIDENDLLSEIETFQAKKSTNKWSLNKLLEILKKITEASQTIINDPIAKSPSFTQTNYFATNNTIELKSRVNGTTHSETINETNTDIKYSDLNINIKNKILEGNSDATFSAIDKINIENLSLKYVDITRTPKNQIEQLYGKSRVVFGNLIQDHKASIDTLLYYLKSIESKFNQGGLALLSDSTKRLESVDIQKIFNILTNQKLAYDFWREKEKEICKALNVSLFDRTQFELHYLNSFDNFKDLKESEHKKIYDFIESNKTIFQNNITEEECILEFFEEFNRKKTTTFRDLQLKAVISAGFVEINNKI
jgi:hypothetical protein